jgi:predicted GTPase
MVPPAGPGAADPMIWTVLGLCEQAAGALAPAARPELTALRSALAEPVRVAVVGQVSSGKSTLVNALIGRRVAPTAATECTQVVTWYRFGAPARAQLVLRDGSVHPLPFDGTLPETLGLDPARVERIDVWLQSGPLRNLTLIDTPGLGSLQRPDSDDALPAAVAGEASVRAAGHATALLFLFSDVEKRGDIEFIRAFRAATEGGPAAAGVIGVLSRADVFGDGPWAAADPLPSARELAERIARDHPALLTAVTPVAALLAAAARTGQVTEAGARTLAALADLDPARLPLLPRFGVPAGVDPADVARLLGELGPYAVARGREIAASGGAAALSDWLVARSGIGRVEELVGRWFVRRGVPLTAERVLRGLRELARTRPLDPAAGGWLRDRIEQAELAPQLHRIAELRARQTLAGVRGPAAADVAAQLDLMIDNDEPWRRVAAARPLPPHELRAAVDQRWDRAQAVLATARDPRVAEAARVLTRSYAVVAEQLRTSREHPGPQAHPRT